jgi:hemolysin III
VAPPGLFSSLTRYHQSVQPKQVTYYLGDILANAITHGIGAGLAIAGAVYLIVVAARGTAVQVVSCSIFAATLILVYICSTLYHSLVRTRARHVFHILDHSAIYLLIAGTYTPFCLVSLRSTLGWTIFGIEWGLAICGVVYKSFAVGQHEVISSLVYLAQGWMAVFAVKPLIHSLGWHGLMWMGAGGVAYTLGIIFFSLDRLRYIHALWHLFVLAGSVAHYFAILFYVVPARP